jgi:hypothetical protein
MGNGIVTQAEADGVIDNHSSPLPPSLPSKGHATFWWLMGKGVVLEAAADGLNSNGPPRAPPQSTTYSLFTHTPEAVDRSSVAGQAAEGA